MSLVSKSVTVTDTYVARGRDATVDHLRFRSRQTLDLPYTPNVKTILTPPSPSSMSSDGYFDSDNFDDAIFEQLDAIEAAHLSPGKDRTLNHAPDHAVKPVTKESSFYDLTFDIDEDELQRLDEFIEDSYQGKAQPVAGPSRSTSRNTHQTTLFGNILPQDPTPNKPRSQIQRTKSTPRNPFGQQAPKTKVWDQTVFAKTGLKQGKAKGKGKAKAKAKYDDDDDDDEEMVEFEQFPAPTVTGTPAFHLV
jgi:ATP-dependent DNA helicase MPH1